MDEEYEACNTFTCRNSELFVVCGGCVVEDNIIYVITIHKVDLPYLNSEVQKSLMVKFM